jgi:hypothetical protein
MKCIKRKRSLEVKDTMCVYNKREKKRNELSDIQPPIPVIGNLNSLPKNFLYDYALELGLNVSERNTKRQIIDKIDRALY